MRKLVLAAVIVVGVGAIALVLLGRTKSYAHTLQVKTFVENAQSLRVGAPVELAGVRIGSVSSVQPRPEMQPNPVEIVMAVNTPYDLKIPNDSTVTLQTAGILGETFAAIDVQGASGPPLKSGELLRAKKVDSPTVQELLARLEALAKQKNCAPQSNANSKSTAK